MSARCSFAPSVTEALAAALLDAPAGAVQVPGSNSGKFASSNESTATQYVSGARSENVQRPSASVSMLLVRVPGHVPVASVTRTLAIGGSSAARVPSATNPPAGPATQPGGGVVGGGCPSLLLSHTSRHTLPPSVAPAVLLAADVAAELAPVVGNAVAAADALVITVVALLVAEVALLGSAVMLLAVGTLGSVGGVVLHAHNTSTVLIQTCCLRITEI